MNIYLNDELNTTYNKKEDNDLEYVMDKTMNRMILDQVCDKYDKFTWEYNEYTKDFFTNFEVKGEIKACIFVDEESADFKIIINNELKVAECSDETQQKREQLVKNISKIYTVISKQDILERLKEL